LLPPLHAGDVNDADGAGDGDVADGDGSGDVEEVDGAEMNEGPDAEPADDAVPMDGEVDAEPGDARAEEDGEARAHDETPDVLLAGGPAIRSSTLDRRSRGDSALCLADDADDR